MNSFPTFVVAGAGKAGTSWLHACCDEHPEIFVPPKNKEIDYFSKFIDNGVEFYSAHYADIPDTINCSGDFSPSYMVDPQVPRRIYELLPDVEIYFVLRNPIDRAYSHYCMHVKGGSVATNPEDYLIPGSRYLEEGLYYRNITRFAEYFSETQIRIFFYDDLTENPVNFVSSFYESLGVNNQFRPHIVDKKFHSRGYRPKYQSLYNILVKHMQYMTNSSVLGARLVKAIRKSNAMAMLREINRGPAYPELSNELRERLHEFFEDDIKHLEKLAGRNLNVWLK
jgi:hypothetical protein